MTNEILLSLRPLACIQFQREIVSHLRALHHDVAEDYPVKTTHADIVDFTAREWIEVDRLTHPLNNLSVFQQRINLVQKKFCLRDKRLKGFRRIFMLDIPQPSGIMEDGDKSVVETFDLTSDLSSVMDEIQIFKNKELFHIFHSNPGKN